MEQFINVFPCENFSHRGATVYTAERPLLSQHAEDHWLESPLEAEIFTLENFNNKNISMIT